MNWSIAKSILSAPIALPSYGLLNEMSRDMGTLKVLHDGLRILGREISSVRRLKSIFIILIWSDN